MTAEGTARIGRIRSRAGFTLLEVMISVGLVAIIATMMYESISITMKSRDKIARVEDLNHSAQVMMTHIKSDISMAFLSNHVSTEEPAFETMFVGREDSLMMTTFSHERRRRGARESDQALVEYRFGSLDGEDVIFRREKAVLDQDPEDGGIEEVIVSGVREFKLSYWDEEEEDWVDEWKVEMEDARKSGLGGEVSPLVAPEGSKFMKQAQEKMLAEYQLPARVYVRLVLEDSEGNAFPFETQVPVHIRLPLNF